MTLALKTGKKYTYKDYLQWPDNERWELIAGVAYNMTPAPSIRHQIVLGNLHRILSSNLLNKPCVPFIAPTDVVLSEEDVVQPDLFIVCDKKKIATDNIQGAPDLIVEILSPATALKDKRGKKVIYEKYGVREYIILDPIENYIERFSLGKDGIYSQSDILGPKEVLKLFSLEKIEISLSEVFEIEKELEEKKS
jgi:Uma2 family endonuclease